MSSTTAVLERQTPAADRVRPDVVNDFSIVVATPNGSGSQTANVSIIRSIFRMGIPVNGKNLFPSNIQGLPTWYTIRISKDGYIARREGTEILIAFNDKTVEQDLANLPLGGVCIYPLDWKFAHERTDVTYYGIPVKEFVKASGAEDKIKNYIANMVYVGALAFVLGIDLEEIKGALHTHFGGKAKPINLNFSVVKMAYDWSKENLTKTDPFRVERMNKTQGKIMIEGNIAAALGAVFGGVQVVGWYPITPATSLEWIPSTSFWATLQGVAPKVSASTRVAVERPPACNWSSRTRAVPSVSSGGALGCTSRAAMAEAESGNTCRAHWRSACASGAWAMIRMLFMGGRRA